MRETGRERESNIRVFSRRFVSGRSVCYQHQSQNAPPPTASIQNTLELAPQNGVGEQIEALYEHQGHDD